MEKLKFIKAIHNASKTLPSLIRDHCFTKEILASENWITMLENIELPSLHVNHV